MFQFDEKIFKHTRDVKYVLQAAPNCKKLVVVFSSFNRITAPIPHTFNYIRSLQNMHCNKLFILDGFGPRGCYYMMEAMNTEIEESVIALIDSIAQELHLTRQDIIAAGSSKGGSSALYYGLKYRFGAVISGAPQIKIADYVTKVAPETADYMLGTPWEPQNIDRLNNAILDYAQNADQTEVNILSSENDWQYKEHVKPFLQRLTQHGAKFNIVVSNKIKDHNDIANHFPQYMIQNILRLIYGVEYSDSCHAELKKDTLQISNVVHGSSGQYRYKLVGQAETSECMTNSEKVKIHVHTPGVYALTMQVLHNASVIYEKAIGKYVYGSSHFKFKDVCYHVSDNKLNFSLDIDALTEDILFSFYLVKDGHAVERQFYQKTPQIEFLIEKGSKYSVLWYIHLCENTVKLSDSHPIALPQ